MAFRAREWRVDLKTAPIAFVSGASLILFAITVEQAAAYALNTMLGLKTFDLSFSRFALSDLAAGIGVVLIFISLAPVAEHAASTIEKWQRPIRSLAGISFTLYIVHWPLLVLLKMHGVAAGNNPLIFVLLLGGVIGICAVIASQTERRSPALRAWLLRKFTGQARLELAKA